MSREFLSPRLVGKRFSQHSVPLDLLKDFSAFEEMLLEIAKRKYLIANPKRKRLPKGFGRYISVNLVSVEKGSAVLRLDLSSGIDSLMPPVEEPYFIEAKNSIIEAIASVEDHSA